MRRSGANAGRSPSGCLCSLLVKVEERALSDPNPTSPPPFVKKQMAWLQRLNHGKRLRAIANFQAEPHGDAAAHVHLGR